MLPCIAKAQQLAVSRTALYDKINGIEPEVSAQLVRYIAQELEPVVKQLGGQIPELLPGYRVKILDGNCLATTEHRLNGKIEAGLSDYYKALGNPRHLPRHDDCYSPNSMGSFFSNDTDAIFLNPPAFGCSN